MKKLNFRLDRYVGWAVVWGACSIVLAQTSSATTFDIIKEATFDEWKAVLYRNQSNKEIFCSLESTKNDPILRIVQYKGTKDTFLEIYNPKWEKITGEVRFTIEFSKGTERLGVELKGKSWGDAYTHDILEQKELKLLVNLLANSVDAKILNSNSAEIARYSLKGSTDASKSFIDCLDGLEAWK